MFPIDMLLFRERRALLKIQLKIKGSPIVQQLTYTQLKAVQGGFKMALPDRWKTATVGCVAGATLGLIPGSIALLGAAAVAGYAATKEKVLE